MKRNIYTLCTAALLAISVLSGCGEPAGTETPSADEMQAAEETEPADPEGKQEETAAEKDLEAYGFSDEYTVGFSDENKTKFEGMIDRSIYANDENMSLTKIYLTELNDGGDMAFSFTGPVEVGEHTDFVEEENLYLMFDNETEDAAADKQLTAWLTYMMDDEIEILKNAEKEMIVSLEGAGCPYRENGYYSRELTDEFLTVTFAVANEDVQGYKRFIVNLQTGKIFNFCYIEANGIYDDTRAGNLVESLTFLS